MELFYTKNTNFSNVSKLSKDDFLGLNEIKHQDVPDLCKKFNIKKNLIKPIYLS